MSDSEPDLNIDILPPGVHLSWRVPSERNWGRENSGVSGEFLTLVTTKVILSLDYLLWEVDSCSPPPTKALSPKDFQSFREHQLEQT